MHSLHASVCLCCDSREQHRRSFARPPLRARTCGVPQPVGMASYRDVDAATATSSAALHHPGHLQPHARCAREALASHPAAHCCALGAHHDLLHLATDMAVASIAISVPQERRLLPPLQSLCCNASLVADSTPPRGSRSQASGGLCCTNAPTLSHQPGLACGSCLPGMVHLAWERRQAVSMAPACTTACSARIALRFGAKYSRIQGRSRCTCPPTSQPGHPPGSAIEAIILVPCHPSASPSVHSVALAMPPNHSRADPPHAPSHPSVIVSKFSTQSPCHFALDEGPTQPLRGQLVAGYSKAAKRKVHLLQCTTTEAQGHPASPASAASSS
jgi:hypothetical protein